MTSRCRSRQPARAAFGYDDTEDREERRTGRSTASPRKVRENSGNDEKRQGTVTTEIITPQRSRGCSPTAATPLNTCPRSRSRRGTVSGAGAAPRVAPCTRRGYEGPHGAHWHRHLERRTAVRRRGREVRDAAAELEALGYTALWIPDVGGDVFGALRDLLDATITIVAATGILNLWMHAADRGGRGLRRARGRPSRAHPARHRRQPLAAHRPDPPGRSTRSRLQVTRRYLDELDAASPTVPPDRRVLAALGPKMLELARDRAGGAHPYLVTPEHTKRRTRGARRGPAAAARAARGARDRRRPRPRHRPRGSHASTCSSPNYVNNWRRARLRRGRLRRRRQRPPHRPRGRVGRRGHHRGPGAGALRRRRRPRVRAGVHRSGASRASPGQNGGHSHQPWWVSHEGDHGHRRVLRRRSPPTRVGGDRVRARVVRRQRRAAPSSRGSPTPASSTRWPSPPSPSSWTRSATPGSPTCPPSSSPSRCSA